MYKEGSLLHKFLFIVQGLPSVSKCQYHLPVATEEMLTPIFVMAITIRQKKQKFQMVMCAELK